MKGVGISMGLANGLGFICLNIYPLFVKEARPAMKLPGSDVVEGIYEYLSKGLPLSLMVFFEWIAFEFMIIMSGQLGVASQATQTIILNAIIFCYGMVIGLQTAMACLIGQQIGK